jgi:hypothetical protein
MIDHNLVGMGGVKIGKYTERDTKTRKTHSFLEIDVHAEDILNTREINPERITPHNKNANLVQSLQLLWEDERNRRKQVGLDSQPSQPPATQFIREQQSQDEIERAMFKRVEELQEELVIASQVRILFSFLTTF